MAAGKSFPGQFLSEWVRLFFLPQIHRVSGGFFQGIRLSQDLRNSLLIYINYQLVILFKLI
jgi:hypothetical protein